ncbi:plectin-like [Plectropomus leopardus]|uniref:plectin-like n=1 Tax=Plectropomus leopardus TaxID=160734 RepID=UPI001C4ABAB1|nr:plectin-like [Plectropomus leopardus]
MMADILQQKVEELVLIQKRAEVAEEKAQSYRKLLDDSNNRLKKLQMDMETERNNMRQKSEDLQQEALNLTKSINELQEEIRSLQRAKSSLEQNAFFQKTEIEGLKEQLKITQGELQKKNSMEQENTHKIHNLEEELASKQAVVDQLKFKCNELTRINVSSDSDIRGLQIQAESLEKDRSFSEQKIKSLKSEIESWKQQLQTANEESNFIKRSEQASQLQCKSLEAKLQKSELVASQLQKRVDELNQTNTEMEKNLKNVKSKLDQVTVEIGSKDQQIKIFKFQAEGTKSQVKIVEEELNKKSQTSHELQMKLQDYSEEIRKMTELQQKIIILNSKIDNYEKEITALKSELKSVVAERNSANHKINMQNTEVNDLNMLLKTRNAELQKETAESLKHLSKVKALEDELYKHKHNIMTSSSESMTGTLKQEIFALQNDKRAADKTVESLNAKLAEVNSSLQRSKDELLKETRERKAKESKILQLETELQRNKAAVQEATSSSDAVQSDKRATDKKVESLNAKLSELNTSLQRTKDELSKETRERKAKESKILQMETELQKNKVAIKEAISSSDKSRSNLQHENTILKREKAEALEKTISLGSEVRTLKEKLHRSQIEADQKQKENSVLQQRAKQMEEQLEKCKKMLEELKSKLELQKEGYERQLLLMQTEIEKKLVLLQSELASESGKSSQLPHSVELAEILNKYFKQDIKQIKTVHHTIVETKQQPDQQLQIKLDKLQQERTKLEHDLIKAKSQISQLEEDRIKLNTKVSSLQSLCNEHPNESARLTDSEWRLTLKENEARALREQIESYVKEVKSLQEKLLTLGVRMKTENQNINKQEVIETICHYVDDNVTATLKTDPTVRLKAAPSYERTKYNLEDEILKMKVSSEMAAMEKENTGLKQVKQEKMEVAHSQSLHDSPTKKTLNSSGNQTPSLLPKDMQSVTYKSQIKPGEPMTMTTHGYMSLCGLTDQWPSEMCSITQTRTYQIKEISETVSTSDSEGKVNAIYSTSQKIPDLKGSTSIQSFIKFKLLDEEVWRKFEEGHVTMEEVQTLLAQYAGEPTAIAGIYVESSKKKISFLEAAEKGFLAKTYALEFLEAQAATGSLTDLSTGQTHSVAEALERGIIEPGQKDKLIEAQKAVSGYLHGGKKLSVFQAMEERILDRYKGKKILEIQVATGGIINPETGVRVPTSIAVDQGLLNKETLQSLYDPVGNPKGFHNPDSGQKAYYSEILKTCLYDIDGGVYLFPVGEKHLTNTSPTSSHRVSVVSSSSGIEMSAYEAFKGRHIDKRTYLFLSQQESEWEEKSTVDDSGNTLHIISDVKSGRQLCLESALSQRFLELSELESYGNGDLCIYEIADIIFSRMVVVDDINSPIAGLWDVTQRKRLSVLQGFQQGFTDRISALRLLEAQACTGGICDPSSGEKVTLSEAVKRGLLDEALNQQLQQFEQVFNGIVHPKTSKTLSISQAIQENLLPKDVGFRCIEFQLLTGGLISPDTHERVSLEEVIQSGLVDKVTATALKDERFHTKSLSCPKTKRRITFREALERSVYDCHTGLRLLEATKVHGLGAKSTFHYVWAYK